MSFTVGKTPLTYDKSHRDIIKVTSRNKNYHVNFSKSVIKPETNDIVIIDRKVDALYNICSISERVFLIDAVEENKNMESVMNVIDFMSKSKMKKDGTMHVVGGGITQDISGMAASMYKRGIDWTFTPTTLLSMCDSCIGSKVNVNFESYKNQIGTMYPPNNVVIDTNFLQTLTKEDIDSGIGEMLKLYTIAGMNWHMKDVEHSIRTCLNIKKTFIEEDEYELTIRPILNYGHTFGHVLETMSEFKIPHGIAVLLGMYVVDAYFGQSLSKYDAYLDTIKQYTKYIVHDEKLFLDILQNDKKVNGDIIKLIQVHDGHSDIVETVIDMKLVKHVYLCINRL